MPHLIEYFEFSFGAMLMSKTFDPLPVILVLGSILVLRNNCIIWEAALVLPCYFLWLQLYVGCCYILYAVACLEIFFFNWSKIQFAKCVL